MDELDRQELVRRLPEIEKIEGSLKRRTIKAFLDHCPAYFWEKPAAASHHPTEHRQRHGLWLHTKRAFVSYERKVRSFRHQELVDDWEVNCGRAAILLHDIFKYGTPPAEDHTVQDHDRIAAEHLDEQSDLPGKVISCIDTHSGPWGGGETPSTDLEQLHHLADLDASDRNLAIAIYKPCEEIAEQFPEVTTAELEDLY